jgi:hypothetical protein
MKNYISAALIAVSIVVLGFCIKAGLDNINSRLVTVRGLAEQIVEADRVTWPIDYSIAGNDLSELYDIMQQNNGVIVNFLTSNGINKDDISVNPPTLYNADSNIYNDGRQQYRYNLSVTVTVATKQVALVRELLNRQSELFKKGVAASNGYINYEYTGLNDIKPDMITEATRNAREAADRFAKDSNSRVGKIQTATQGQFSIEAADESTPNLKKVRVVSTIVYQLDN